MGSGFKLVLLATVCSICLALSTGPAFASTYCVGTGTCPTGTNEASIQAAFDAAGTHPGADTVLIGPLGSPYIGDFNYGYAADPVSVIGVGADKPVIQALPGGTYAMRVNATAAALVQNLAFVAPNENGGTGLAWTGIADNIAVTHTGTGKEIHPLFPYGDALLENSHVKAEGGGYGDGINLQLSTGFTMRDSTLDGDTRVGLNTVVSNPAVILQRVSLIAHTTALQISGTGSDVVAQQLFAKSTALTATGSVISMLNGTHLDATHATLVANGIGRGVTASASTDSTLAELTNSLVANVAYSGITSGGGGNAGTLTFTHSMVPAAPVAYVGGVANMGAGAVVGVPSFVDAAAGNYHLRAPQAAIDAADPADATTLDLARKPRIVDGDGTGGARSDFGAFEYQHDAPVVAAVIAATIRQNAPAAFSAAGSSDADPGDTLSFAWAFGDGSTGSGASVTHAFAAEGIKTVTLTATDQTGLSSTTTGQILVTDGIAPKITIGKPKPNAKGTAVTYKLGCPKTEVRCTVTAAIAAASGKKKSLAKGAKVVVKGGASRTLTLRLSRTTLKSIARSGKLKTKVRFVGTDAAGNTKTVVQKYTAKQGKSGSAINRK